MNFFKGAFLAAAIASGIFLMGIGSGSLLHHYFGKNEEQKYQTLVEKVKNASFRLAFNKSPFCTGFVVGRNFALTAGHCVTPDVSLAAKAGTLVSLPFEPKNKYRSRINPLGAIGRFDWGFVTGSFANYNRLEVDTMGELIQVGRKVVICGGPLGSMDFRCYLTKIQRLEGFNIIIGGIVMPGQSGGAVVDFETGKVIGITSAVKLEPQSKKGDIIVSTVVGMPIQK